MTHEFNPYPIYIDLPQARPELVFGLHWGVGVRNAIVSELEDPVLCVNVLFRGQFKVEHEKRLYRAQILIELGQLGVIKAFKQFVFVALGICEHTSAKYHKKLHNFTNWGARILENL